MTPRTTPATSTTATTTTTVTFAWTAQNLILPRFERLSGSNVFASQLSSYDDMQAKYATAVALSSINQRSAFSYEFSVEGDYAVGESNLKTPSGKRGVVSMVLRTPVVHEESPYVKAWVWTHGSSFGSFTSSSVTLTISRNGVTSQTINCGNFGSSAIGGKDCAAQLASRFFDGSSAKPSIVATMSGNSFESDPVEFAVTVKPSFSRPAAVKMWLDLPTYALLPGSEFDVTLYANTEADGELYALGVWSASISSTNGFSLESISSVMFDVSDSTVGGVTSMAATFKSSYSDRTDELTGDAVAVAVLTYSVSSSLSSSTIENIFALSIDDMVSISNSKKVDDVEGHVLSVAGFASRGELEVESEYVAGLLAYVDLSNEQELLNTAVLDGLDVTSVITKKEVKSCHTVGSASCSESGSVSSVSGSVSCSQSNSAALRLNSACNAVLTSAESEGDDNVDVTVMYGDFERVVSFRVWFPLDIELNVQDSTLSRIASECRGRNRVFQQSRVVVSGTWSCVAATSDRVDVTSLSTVDSSNEAAVLVSDGIAFGVDVGSSTLSTLSGAEVEVAVSNVAVVPQVMHAAVINYIERAVDYSVSTFSLLETSSLRATAGHSLTAEGDIAHVFAYVQFDDGNTMYVGDSTVLTNFDTNYIQEVSGDERAVEVVQGALSIQSSSLVDVSWVQCDEVVLTAQPWFNISMPAVVGVDVVSDVDTIVAEGDALSQPPVNFPTEATLSVTLHFDDGSSRDMTLDSRTQYTCLNADVTLNGNVASTSTITDSSVFEVVVSFGEMTPLVGSVSVSVDAMSSLVLNSEAYPACSTGGCAGKVTMSKLWTSSGSYFQQLTLSATAMSELGESVTFALNSKVRVTLSDVTVVDVAGSSVCSSSTLECVITNGALSNQALVGKSGGTADVQIVWAGESASLALTVDVDPVTVSSISIGALSSSGGNFYVRGKLGTEESLSLSVVFSDATKLTSVDAGAETDLGLPSFDSYISFSSSDAAALSVSSGGVLTVNANSFGYEAAVVVAMSKEDTSVSDSVEVFSNVDADCYDVDVGNLNGAPFSFSVNSAGKFSLPVRINTCTSKLTGFQIQLYFDSDVIQAVNGGESSSNNWPYTITYTYGSPSSMVQLISSVPASTKKGLLTLSTLQFVKVGSGPTTISGVIVEALGAGGAVIVSDGDFVAGLGGVSFGSRRGRSLADVRKPSPQVLYKRRSLACSDVSCGCDGELLRGDINGDCKFTIGDLDFLKRYYTNPNDGGLTWYDSDYQIGEMDPDQNELIDGIDILFVLYALAKKYRFLIADESGAVVDSSCLLTLEVSLKDDIGNYVTDGTTTTVTADVAGLVNFDGAGLDYDVHGSHFVFDMEVSTSSFILSLPLVESNAGLEVAFMVATYEDSGTSDAQRKFPWWGSTYGDYAADFEFVPFYVVSVPATCPQESTTTTTSTTTAAVTSTSTTTVTMTTTMTTTTSTATISETTTTTQFMTTTSFKTITTTSPLTTQMKSTTSTTSPTTPGTGTPTATTTSTSDMTKSFTSAPALFSSTSIGVAASDSKTSLPMSTLRTALPDTTLLPQGSTVHFDLSHQTSAAATGTVELFSTHASHNDSLVSTPPATADMSLPFASSGTVTTDFGVFSPTTVPAAPNYSIVVPVSTSDRAFEGTPVTVPSTAVSTRSTFFSANVSSSATNELTLSARVTNFTGAGSTFDSSQVTSSQVGFTSLLTTRAPPVDCQGAWSVWGACSVSCRGGIRTRTFRVTLPANQGGASCNVADGLIEGNDCEQQSCPSNSTVLDGVLQNAFCFQDCNCNFVFDHEEPSARTNGEGLCALVFDNDCGVTPTCSPRIFASTDAETVDLQGKYVLDGLSLVAPCLNGTCQDIVVSPLSTLMVTLNTTPEILLPSLGLPASIDILKLNPFSRDIALSGGNSESVFKLKAANNQLAATVVSFAAAFNGDHNVLATHVYRAVANVVMNITSQGDVFRFGNVSQLMAVADSLLNDATVHNTSNLSREGLYMLLSTTAIALSNVNAFIAETVGVPSTVDQLSSGAVSNIAVLQAQVRLSAAAMTANTSLARELVEFVSLDAVQSSATNSPPSNILLSGTRLDRTLSNITVGHVMSIDDKTVEGEFQYSLLGDHADAFTIGIDDQVLRFKQSNGTLPRGQVFRITISSTDTGKKTFVKNFVIMAVDLAVDFPTSEFPASTVAPDLSIELVLGLGGIVGLAVGGVFLLAVAVIVPVVVFGARKKMLQQEQYAPKQAPLLPSTAVTVSPENMQRQPPEVGEARVKFDSPPRQKKPATVIKKSKKSKKHKKQRNARLDKAYDVDSAGSVGAMSGGSGSEFLTDEDSSTVDVFFDDDEKKREEAWQLTRSVRFLNQSLSTPAGRKTLQNIADLYYEGNTRKAHAYLVYKLQNEVKTAQTQSEQETSTEDEFMAQQARHSNAMRGRGGNSTASSDANVHGGGARSSGGSSGDEFLQPTAATEQFVDELVHVMDEVIDELSSSNYEKF
eukprot:INCI4994.1.p1 GENE.INCI4994.1~~INCI4994.1.p1  ORF type:complete len:2546 (-),score=475.07 INCI4994.1:90-7562(-)